MPTTDWEWDETLYSGSAAHYGAGRMAYPPDLVDVLCTAIGLDGTGRLLDVGCGPGSLTLLIAPHVEAAVGVDADREMILEARRRAADAKAGNIEWRQLRAEELPADLGAFRVVTFAQSFHWMDQPVVARRVRDMLTTGGRWVHVQASTHRGVPGDEALPHPHPPWDRIDELVAGYLGPVRRAGRGVLPNGTRGGEEDVMRAAGFAGPTRIEVGGGQVVDRDADDITAAVYSLSSSTPHLFGGRLPDFDTDLRRLLRQTSPAGRFSELTAEIAVVIWRP
jgi:SAM-dependent methyltransferase